MTKKLLWENFCPKCLQAFDWYCIDQRSSESGSESENDEEDEELDELSSEENKEELTQVTPAMIVDWKKSLEVWVSLISKAGFDALNNY